MTFVEIQILFVLTVVFLRLALSIRATPEFKSPLR